MSKKTRRIVFAVVVLQALLIIGLLALPAIVQAIPGRFRVRLQSMPIAGSVIELMTTPIATAFPTLSGVSSQATAELPADVAALLGGQATRPTLAPTNTTMPTSTPAPPSPDNTTTPSPSPMPSPSPAPTETPTPLPTEAHLEGMVAIPQSFNNCGPANLTQVLNFYNSPVTQAEVAAELKPNEEDRNVSPWQIYEFVNSQTTLRATYHSGGDLELLKRLVAAGFPVVVEKGYLEEACGWCGHYLTVHGYDDATQEFRTADSYLGPFDGGDRLESYEDLNTLWQHFNYTFYVVYEPERESELFAILGPQMLDEVAMYEHAAEIARAETDADPDNAFAWHNLGSSLVEVAWRTGDQSYYQAATEAFDRALEVRPALPTRILWYQFGLYKAYLKTGRYQDVVALADTILVETGGRNVEETYYYKGWALYAMGNITSAVDHLQIALERNPNFSPARLLLDSIG
jgi:tetratricopeptide (TPR) repeat protein